MQSEITEKRHLLDKKGKITKEGWARYPYWEYNRKDIHSTPLGIKEWDYYAITNQIEEYSIAVTISDLGYAGLIAISYIDYKRKAYAQTDFTKIMPFGKIKLSPNTTSESYVTQSSPSLRACFITKDNLRHLMFSAPELVLPDGSVGLNVDITLKKMEDSQSMNIATSWIEKRKAFYLNEKINCLDVTGEITRGYEVEQIKPFSTFGVLDWGRGRWTYNNTWYWASLSTLINNIHFGFNLGYGFSDRNSASENAIFYNGLIHKVDDIKFNIPKNYLESDWILESNTNKINLVFTPLVDRTSHFNYGIIKSDQHQVFGKFQGTAVLDDGSIVNIDNILGFAEKVSNRW